MSHFIRLPDRFATYVGIDLHTVALTLAALPAGDGPMVRRTIPTHCTGSLVRFVHELPTPVCVGIESMGTYYWLWDVLLPLVEQLVLVDALDLSKLSPRQASTDRTVSAKIAHLLRDGEVPAAYVPGKDIRHLRQLGRQWHAVTEMATTAKVQIRWQFYQNNLRGPRDINGASLNRYLAAQAEKLEALPTRLVQNWEQVMVAVEQVRTRLRREMLVIVRSSQVLRHRLELLTHARGIGDILGIIVLAEFGDFHRFGNADAVACWTGLTERSHVSNRQKYPGRISKAGSATLRWALGEIGFQIACSDVMYHEIYEAILARTGVPGKARTAIARRAARYIWKAIVSDTPFRIGESRKRTAAANQARQAKRRRHQRRQKALAETKSA